jgi:CubicO group peptidase (beta-lactamase class C family)
MSGKNKWKQLCEIAEESRQKHKVPGVVLGILHKGKIKAAGFGVTNLEHPLDVTTDTLFQIGSNTKTYTGTLIMMLVEQGKLDLDQPVRAYLPDFKVADKATSEQVTIRHLLTHTSGWAGDFFFDTGPGEDACAKYVAAMADLEQVSPLGEFWSYNNAGFSLLGYLIETITGQRYEEALKEMLIEPLGLKNTFFEPGDVLTYRFAVGHYEGYVARPWPLPRSAYAAGGITCNVQDLLTYAKFHLGDGKISEEVQLLSKTSLTQMQTPQVTVWDKASWGLPWSIDDTYETRLVAHGGGTNGQVSLFSLVPEKQFAWAIFTNAGNGGKTGAEIEKKILKDYLGIDIEDPKPMQASEQQLASFVGKYSRPFMDIHLGILGGRLIGRMTYKKGFPDNDSPPPPAPPPFSLDLVEENRLMVLDGSLKEAKVDVFRKPDGSIGWLRSGRLHKKVE